MARLYLVRHGEASAGWDEARDPGLNDLGRLQAKVTARALAPLGPLAIISSPLLRAKETSKPLAEIWGRKPRVEERVAEIPTPVKDLSERTQWLRGVMGDTWSNLSQELQAWRRGVIEALSELDVGAVVFTHFIAINAAVGEATGNHRVVCFWPDNGSVTVVEVNGMTLTLVESGVEAATNKRPGVLV